MAGDVDAQVVCLVYLVVELELRFPTCRIGHQISICEGDGVFEIRILQRLGRSRPPPAVKRNSHTNLARSWPALVNCPTSQSHVNALEFPFWSSGSRYQE